MWASFVVGLVLRFESVSGFGVAFAYLRGGVGFADDGSGVLPFGWGGFAGEGPGGLAGGAVGDVFAFGREAEGAAGEVGGDGAAGGGAGAGADAGEGVERAPGAGPAMTRPRLGGTPWGTRGATASARPRSMPVTQARAGLAGGRLARVRPARRRVALGR